MTKIMTKTVRNLVDDVHQAAIAKGIDINPSDVGFLLSLFLESFNDDGALPGIQAIADECAAVKDE